MALTTGTGLTNKSDVMDAVRAHLEADGWTTVINSGTVGSDNKEIWMNLPTANTFIGEFDLTIGMTGKDADTMYISPTPLTPTEALLTPPGSPATRNTFLRVLGTPNVIYQNDSPPGNAGDVMPNGWALSQNLNASPCQTDGWNQGGSYLSHWIFTPNQSPIGSLGPVYCICVVEVATGVYRTFGFGEGIKLGASGWVGGLWVDGTDVRTGVQARSRYFAAGGTIYNGFSHEGENGYVLNYNNDSYLNATGGAVQSPRTWNPWMFLGVPWTTDWVGTAGMGGLGATTQVGLGSEFIDRGTAGFSGQTIRVPSRVYGQNVRVGAFTDQRMRPLMEIPDVFHMNIASFTPGEVITDDTEKFLVVPYVSKTGTDNSGNRGFLVRHPDL